LIIFPIFSRNSPLVHSPTMQSCSKPAISFLIPFGLLPFRTRSTSPSFLFDSVPLFLVDVLAPPNEGTSQTFFFANEGPGCPWFSFFFPLRPPRSGRRVLRGASQTSFFFPLPRFEYGSRLAEKCRAVACRPSVYFSVSSRRGWDRFFFMSLDGLSPQSVEF